jgi:hypothetical protein
MIAAGELPTIESGMKAMQERTPGVVMTIREITDPKERAERQAWQERADRNAAWLQAHASEVYPRHRGQFICIAGEELFVADTVEEVLRLARTAHPEDDAFFLRCIPRERVARIDAG